MRHHSIVGGGGCRLHVVEEGNSRGPAVLFIHGFSQCALAWGRQLGSELARDYRLVAIDLRGHGSSEVPRDGYDDPRLWADDVHAVLRELDLDHPVLCGWSYGPLVILDYIRHYGEERIGGIHFVAGVTKLGSEAAAGLLTPEFLALVPAFFSSDTEETVRGLSSLLRLCFNRTPSATELYTMLGYGISVPPFVRQALFSRAVDNDDLLPAIHLPVLLTHGAEDAIVKKEAVDQHRAALADARVHMMPNAGHAPFWDDAPAFNRRLAAFCDEVQQGIGGQSALTTRDPARRS
jgi:non-heme chloroperoxidase